MYNLPTQVGMPIVSVEHKSTFRMLHVHQFLDILSENYYILGVDISTKSIVNITVPQKFNSIMNYLMLNKMIIKTDITFDPHLALFTCIPLKCNLGQFLDKNIENMTDFKSYQEEIVEVTSITRYITAENDYWILKKSDGKIIKVLDINTRLAYSVMSLLSNIASNDHKLFISKSIYNL